MSKPFSSISCIHLLITEALILDLLSIQPSKNDQNDWKGITLSVSVLLLQCAWLACLSLWTFPTREKSNETLYVQILPHYVFCIEENNTQESLVLVTEYKLVCFFLFFFCKDFSHNYMLYIRYFCNERSPNRNLKDYRNVLLTMFW